MKNATIYTIAAICGLVAFIYTLVAAAPIHRSQQRGIGYARGYMALDAVPRTRAELEQTVRQNPGRGGAWYQLARVYRDAGEETAEKDAWAHAAPLRLEAAKRDPAFWFEAGFAFSMAGQKEEAQEPLTRAEEVLTEYCRDRDEGSAWHRLGWTRHLLGREDEARMAWSRAILTLPPKDATSAGPGELYNLACYLCLMGESDEALDVLERAIGAGYLDVQHAEHDEDFEAIKDDPRFKAVIQHMREAINGVRIERGP